MFVKVCGITNREDALAAVEHGARALGFIFHPPSPRFIEPRPLAAWIGAIPGDICRVGVFVNRPPGEIEITCRDLALDVAQLHGTEEPSDLPQGVRVWKAFRVTSTLPATAMDFPAEAVLLDGPASGQAFDWSLARPLKRNVVLAGGLNEHNVAEAIETARPWGIDACSCLEHSPGKKDRARMARFLKACQPIFSI